MNEILTEFAELLVKSGYADRCYGGAFQHVKNRAFFPIILVINGKGEPLEILKDNIVGNRQAQAAEDYLLSSAT